MINLVKNVIPMISLEKPTNFISKAEASGCFVEHNGDILLLLRSGDDTYPNLWTLPSGEHNEGEDKYAAVIREIFEETGLKVQKEEVRFLQTFYMHLEEYNIDLTYHLFQTALNERKEIVLSKDEHSAYQWIDPRAALSLPLTPYLDWCIDWVYKK